MSFGLFLATALAMVFVIEGLAYAFFPQAVQNMMRAAGALPPAKLRGFGMIMAAAGFILLGAVQSLAGG